MGKVKGEFKLFISLEPTGYKREWREVKGDLNLGSIKKPKGNIRSIYLQYKEPPRNIFGQFLGHGED